MRGLGLVDRDDGLTEEGDTLARRFVASCKPKDSTGKTLMPPSACLSELRAREAEVIARTLGLRKKGTIAADDNTRSARRGALEREIRSLFHGGFAIGDVLAKYETNRFRAPTPTVAALREAAIWERLALGLHAVFLLWLRHIEHPSTAKRMVTVARRSRVAGGQYEDIAIGDDTARQAIGSIRRGLRLRARLPADALRHCDPTAFELGEAVVGSTSIDEVFERLRARHSQAKGDDAWIREGGKELARDADDKWQLPTRATLHGYRLAAFGSLLHDLHRARRRG